MADYTLQILTTNYSGQTAEIVFSPCSGGTINLGNQVLPYDYVSEYIYGDYELTFSAYGGSVCYLNIPCPSPTPTTTITSTMTPTPTTTPEPSITPTVTPTNTPTPSPVWYLIINNTNTTRSVTAVNFNGITEPLESGSYPVVNGNGYSDSHPAVSGSGGDAMLITFGGTGFCGPNSKILKNGVDTGFPIANYAGNPLNVGGVAFLSSDIITIFID